MVLLDVLGNLALAAGRYGEALAASDRALARAPNAAAVHNDRGSALAELGRFDEAHAAFGRAIGETMTVLMATGSARQLTTNIFNPTNTSTAASPPMTWRIAE